MDEVYHLHQHHPSDVTSPVMTSHITSSMMSQISLQLTARASDNLALKWPASNESSSTGGT